MKLKEAYEDAYFSLNAGGVPVVLSRWRREGDAKVRVFEVRMRWTGSRDPHSSQRSPMIVESRIRQPHGWQEWRLDATPFSVDDITDYAEWTVRHPRHRGQGKDFECRRCEELELRTDAFMLTVYGPFQNEKHTCALHLFPESEQPNPP